MYIYISPDVPSLVSGSGIGFIDPHMWHFRDTSGQPTSAYKWELKEHREDMAKIPDQWIPYKHDIFNLDDKVFQTGHYEHTLFRYEL